jgi:NADPH2:quinone reductase
MPLRAQITRYGGPEVIEWIEDDLPGPGAGEVSMRHTAVGLNYIDTYHRSGLYPVKLPSGLGLEAAGVVEAVGEGVTDFAVGDRVCTFGPALGAYSTKRNLPATHLFPTPDSVSDEVAAASLLKACTAEFLVERCAEVQSGWPVLVHSAAGGVGLFLVQWLKHLGASVIGTVSTEAKAELARQAGADHVILTSHPDIGGEVRSLTDGLGVKIVFDGVGADTWDISLKAAANRGLVISYGNASGPITGVEIGQLAANGSLFVTRPTLFAYYDAATDRESGSTRVFEMLASGVLTANIGQRFELRHAAHAHKLLENRETSGSTLLLP